MKARDTSPYILVPCNGNVDLVPLVLYTMGSPSQHEWHPWWLVEHREGHLRAQKLLMGETPKSHILPRAATQSSLHHPPVWFTTVFDRYQE